jgi:hypothetical protein
MQILSERLFYPWRCESLLGMPMIESHSIHVAAEIIGETCKAYMLDDGARKVWLPKRAHPFFLTAGKAPDSPSNCELVSLSVQRHANHCKALLYAL